MSLAPDMSGAFEASRSARASSDKNLFRGLSFDLHLKAIHSSSNLAAKLVDSVCAALWDFVRKDRTMRGHL
ncbi:MAG: hypothetical protein CMF65_13960 [Magnetovibrio sp.]|nr:hypothetical protein [Magnetovibrio sp.]